MHGIAVFPLWSRDRVPINVPFLHRKADKNLPEVALLPSPENATHCSVTSSLKIINLEKLQFYPKVML